jgi:hypothetical protein
MRRAEAVIRTMVAFFQSELGKATVALFLGVICFCWPAVVGYPAGAACLYYAIHQFRPVAVGIYHDLRADLNDGSPWEGSAG